MAGKPDRLKDLVDALIDAVKEYTAHRDEFLDAREAALLLGMPESTFRENAERLGLVPIDLNDGLVDGQKPFTNRWRWLRSEVEAKRQQLIAARNERYRELREMVRAAVM
jgi:hypothetical protein